MQPTLVSVVQNEENAIHWINLYPLDNATSTEYNTINWCDATHFELEDDYRTGCQNVSHCQQQQSYSGLCSPTRSYSTFLWRFLYNSLGIIPCVLFGYDNTQKSMLRRNFILGCRNFIFLCFGVSLLINDNKWRKIKLKPRLKLNFASSQILQM